MSRNVLLSILFLVAAFLQPSFAQLPWKKYVTITDSVYSETLKTWRSYNALIPSSYYKNPEKNYPVLYLLHGMSDDHRSWSEKGRVEDVAERLTASGECCEMVIVTPCAGNIDVKNVWNGYFNMPGWSYETFFFEEFLPTIEKRFRCGGHKNQRAIAGLSMGGGGSLSYAQRYPDMFSSVYAMSAFLHHDQLNRTPSNKADYLMQSVNEYSCLDFLTDCDNEKRKALSSLQWWVDCGDDDFLLTGNLQFYQKMQHARIPCQLRVRDGGHDWEYWHTALYVCLPFVSRNFK